MCKCKCKCEGKSSCCGLLGNEKATVCFISLMAAALYTLGGLLTANSKKPSALLKRFFFSAAGFMVGQFIASLLIPEHFDKKTEE